MKTFLLGVGAQKAGTSWLHWYLSQCAEVDFGFRKEYHVFDYFDLDDSRIYANKAIAKALRKIGSFRGILPTRSNKNLRRLLSFYANEDNYYSYFKEVLRRGKQLTGDFTPGYSGLSVRRFRDIRARMLDIGVQTKVIFLMRDPVERCISAFRMGVRNHPQFVIPDRDDFVSKVCESYSFRYRSSYKETISNLLRSFPEEDILFGFYEELFEVNEVKRICNFLGITGVSADFLKKVNSFPDNSRFDDYFDSKLRAQLRAFYEETYCFVAEMFGTEKVKNLWPNYQLRDTLLR